MLYVPALNEVFKALVPFDAMIGFVLQFWYWLTNNVSEEIDQAGSRLHLSAISRKWEAVLSNLQESDTQRPYIRGDGIRLALDPLWRHVV
jgi:hypothetical protein